jgi:predicted Holliday junction resolvase-like endonuclease
MQDKISLMMMAILILAIIVLIYQYSSARQREASQKETIAQLQMQIELRAKQQYESWRVQEIEEIHRQQRDIALREASVALERWKSESETFIRSDAIGRSQSVIVGKVTEHLVPYLPDFRFNPKDARFVGSPVDLMVFDGLDEGELRNIFFIEVKTGASSSLSSRQRQIRDAVQAGRVKWIELRIDRQDSATGKLF